MVTIAAGTTASDESVTCPRMALVVSPWADASLGTRRTTARAERAPWAKKRRTPVQRSLIVFPLEFPEQVAGKLFPAILNQNIPEVINYDKHNLAKHDLVKKTKRLAECPHPRRVARPFRVTS